MWVCVHACCRYGMVLQQCAHFYNNVATEMIPCQKPMMLAEAVEFEKVGYLPPTQVCRILLPCLLPCKPTELELVVVLGRLSSVRCITQTPCHTELAALQLHAGLHQP